MSLVAQVQILDEHLYGMRQQELYIFASEYKLVVNGYRINRVFCYFVEKHFYWESHKAMVLVFTTASVRFAMLKWLI